MHYHYWFDLHELICTKFKINNWEHPKDLHLKTWTYVWVIKKFRSLKNEGYSENFQKWFKVKDMKRKKHKVLSCL